MEIIGWIVTFLFGVCYWPQLWRSYRRKSVGDISVVSWIIQTIAYLLGINYGIWLHEAPLIFGYIHGLICSVSFLIMWWRYEK
ncbi:MAG: SemiSWEET family sugar transporter [bacterium]